MTRAREIFCDVVEAICGALAEWAMACCKNLDSGGAAQAVQQGKQKSASIIPDWEKIIR